MQAVGNGDEKGKEDGGGGKFLFVSKVEKTGL